MYTTFLKFYFKKESFNIFLHSHIIKVETDLVLEINQNQALIQPQINIKINQTVTVYKFDPDCAQVLR